MNKKQIDKIKNILEESNNVLPKLTDKQLEMYSSEDRKNLGRRTINNNRNKKSSSKGGKIGGKITAAKAQKEKIGFFGASKEQIKIWRAQPRPYRRKLSEIDIKFIIKNYEFSNNQYDLNKNKMSLKNLADKFNVSKTTIKRVIDKYNK